MSFSNEHVYFWPGDVAGPIVRGERLLAHYASDLPLVWRCRTLELLDANPSTVSLLRQSVDGLQATKLIRAADPNAKIIIVTDHNEPDMRVAAKAAGATAFLEKENLAKLSDLLDGQNQPSSSAM